MNLNNFELNISRLYTFYPSRLPVFNSTDYIDQSLFNSTVEEYRKGGMGRSALVQGGYQMAAVTVTLSMAIVSGALTGLLMRLPLFEQIEEAVECFDDEPHWITPADFVDLQTLTKTEGEEEQVENKV